MEKIKSNGQVKSVPVPAPTPPQDPFDQIKALVEKVGKKQYAAGYKRAMHLIARGVGSLDTESRAKMANTLDQLELEFHQSELAGQ